MTTIEDLYSQEAENNILSICLVDETKLSNILSILKMEDFYQPEHRLIFKAIFDLHKQGKPTDNVSVAELLKFNGELKRCNATLADVTMNYITSRGWEQSCKSIIKYSKKRCLLNLCRECIQKLEDKEDVDNVASSLYVNANEVLTRTSHTSFVGLDVGFMEFYKDVELMCESQTGTLGLPTGIPSLDNLTSGLCKGKLYILGARPAVGKSALAQQIGEYVAQQSDKNVLFFTLEMTTCQYAERSVQRRTGYTLEHLRRQPEERDKILEAFCQAGEEMSSEKLRIVSGCRINIGDIEKNIVQCKQQYGSCDLVIIDYLQLMGSIDGKRMDDYKKVTENSQGLKQLALKYDIPILALCQLSRTLEQRADKRPILSDLRDSGSIEQDADVVLFLYRDEVHNQFNPNNVGKSELIVAKNRGGRAGTSIRMRFQGIRTQFTEGW